MSHMVEVKHICAQNCTADLMVYSLISGNLTSQYENSLLDSDPPRLYMPHSISHLKVGEYM